MWLLGLALAGCSGASTHQPDPTGTEPVAPPTAAEGTPRAADPPRETRSMTTESDPVIKLLELPDAEYFTIPQQRLLALQSALSDAVEAGADDPSALPPRIALGAPQRVDLKAHPTIPVLLGSFYSGMRAWQVNFQPNLLVLVKDHASGDIAFATPLVSMRRGLQPLPSGGGEPPDEINASATYSGVKLLDLKAKLEVPPRAGRISVTAIYHDVRSNTVGMTLEGDAPPARPIAAASPFVRHELDKRSILAPELEVPRSGSASAGLKIRVAIQTADEGAIVRTEFNQPLLSGHVILVRLDQKPEIVPTFVPVQPVEDGEGKPAYNALLIADLGGKDGRPITAGEYQVYIDVGVELRGPFALTVTE